MREFNLNSALVCEGIVGDGCGGGRIFYVEDERLCAYDPMTQESIILLKKIKSARSIEKKACIITIKTQEGSIEFNLAEFQASE